MDQKWKSQKQKGNQKRKEYLKRSENFLSYEYIITGNDEIFVEQPRKLI